MKINRLRMKNLNFTVGILTTLLLTLIGANANGQGCSDAGFCTINSLKPHELISVSENSADELIADLESNNCMAAQVGEVTNHLPGHIRIIK